LRIFSFGGYGLALAALALVVFGAYDSYPKNNSPEKFLEEKMIEGQREFIYYLNRIYNRHQNCFLFTQ